MANLPQPVNVAYASMHLPADVFFLCIEKGLGFSEVNQRPVDLEINSREKIKIVQSRLSFAQMELDNNEPALEISITLLDKENVTVRKIMILFSLQNWGKTTTKYRDGKEESIAGWNLLDQFVDLFFSGMNAHEKQIIKQRIIHRDEDFYFNDYCGYISRSYAKKTNEQIKFYFLNEKPSKLTAICNRVFYCLPKRAQINWEYSKDQIDLRRERFMAQFHERFVQHPNIRSALGVLKLATFSV